MKGGIRIQDAVVGDIEPTETELSLIEDPAMQRLRWIRQVGFANLIYPSANHTRFEHSLGTMKRTRELSSRLNGGEPDEALEAAGLMHDIGHTAFSHASDNLLGRYLKTTHEDLGEEIIRKSSIADVIGNSTFTMKKVLDYFNGKSKGEVVTGSIGSDRLDYLIRDAHYTGVAYGLIDYSNIRNKFTLYKGSPAIFESAVRSVEYMLIARYSMFSSVYLHHAAQIADGMYEKAVANAIDSGKMDAKELRNIVDWSMTAKLLATKDSKDLMQRLLERRLFKRAYNNAVPVGLKLSEVASAIEKSGMDRNSYVAVFVEYKGSKDNLPVVNRDGQLVGQITEVSPLMKTLQLILSSAPKLLVACDRKNTEKINSALKKLL